MLPHTELSEPAPSQASSPLPSGDTHRHSAATVSVLRTRPNLSLSGISGRIGRVTRTQTLIFT